MSKKKIVPIVTNPVEPAPEQQYMVCWCDDHTGHCGSEGIMNKADAEEHIASKGNVRAAVAPHRPEGADVKPERRIRYWLQPVVVHI